MQTATPGAQVLYRKGKSLIEREAFATLAGGFPAAFRLQVRAAAILFCDWHCPRTEPLNGHAPHE